MTSFLGSLGGGDPHGVEGKCAGNVCPCLIEPQPEREDGKAPIHGAIWP